MKIKRLVTISILGLALAVPVKTVANQNWEGLEELVLRNSVKSQVVMFGEEHKSYRLDNDFVAELLPKLKEQGYEYLALELPRNPIEIGRKILSYYALGKLKKDEINPSWIREEKEKSPGWFDLIDAAKKAKMKIVCYDVNEKELISSDKREEKAFSNLKDLIFDKYPDAKVIVYCGAAHLHEKPVYDAYLELFEESKGLIKKGEHKGFEFTCLGFYLDKLTQDKTLTVSLVPLFSTPPYCDLIINLMSSRYIELQYEN